MEMAWQKLIEIVDGPLGLIAIVLIFLLQRRLFALEDWVRNELSETLKQNTQAITKITEHRRKEDH